LPVARSRLFAVWFSARCLLLCRLWSIALLSVVFSTLSFPRCLLSVAGCPLPVARCTVSVALNVIVACCMLHEVWRMLPVARCMSSVIRCILAAECCPDVVCCMFNVMSSVACCLLHVACRLLSAAHLPVVSCRLSLAALLSVGSCLLHALRRISHARHVACRPLRVVTLHVAWPTSPVACYLLSVACSHPARRRFHVVSGPLPVPSCMASVACRRCRATPRRRAPSASWRRIAIERLSRRRGPLQTEVGVRACVRACVRVGSKRHGVFDDCRACIGRIRARAIEYK